MIVFQFYPNGEFSQGVDTSTGRRKRVEKQELDGKPLDKECRDGYLHWVAEPLNADIRLCTPGQQFLDEKGATYTLLYTDEEGGHYCIEEGDRVNEHVVIAEPIGRLVGKKILVPLVYQEVESSPQVKSRKKLNQITGSMARNIRNACYILERENGKETLSFATLTLPGLQDDDLVKCCERWDYMVDQVLKALRKKVEKYGIEHQYCYCTEIQTQRYENGKGYAPHLHIVFKGRRSRKSAWVFTPKQIRKIWGCIIAKVCGHNEFAKDALENLQRIKYSVSRYLGKYLSKGACSIAGINETDEPITRLQTQWGGMARTIARKIKRSTTRLTSAGNNGQLALDIFRNLDVLHEAGHITYLRRKEIPLNRCGLDGVERVLKVCYGSLSRPTLDGGLIHICQYIDTLRNV